MSVKDVCRNVKIFNDTMGTVGEICVLVKFSPKRENMLGEIKENIDADFDEECLSISSIRLQVDSYGYGRIHKAYTQIFK